MGARFEVCDVSPRRTMTSRTLSIVLTHQDAAAVDALVRWWLRYVNCDDLLIVHTGQVEEFGKIAHAHRLHVADPRVATRDHQRELQSYTSILRAAAVEVANGAWDYVSFSEYDHLPLSSDADWARIALLHDTRADVLGYELLRVDSTNQSHWLYSDLAGSGAAHLQSISQRDDYSIVLSMFGSGSFWTRDAFLAVAERSEPFPVYLELWLPTVAHHLGFRVLDMGEQNRWVSAGRDRSDEIGEARKAGAWTLHPVKELSRIETS